MHVFRNEHKQGVLQVRPKQTASLDSHCPKWSWRTGPGRRQQCGRLGSSSPVSQSSSHGGACHVLTAFICSLWKPEDWFTSEREKTQWLAVSPASEALNALGQAVKHLLALEKTLHNANRLGTPRHQVFIWIHLFQWTGKDSAPWNFAAGMLEWRRNLLTWM